MKIVISFFIVVLFVSQQPLDAQNNNDSLKILLNQVLDKWHHDAATFNHEVYIGAMTDNGVFIGTDATENWTRAEFSTWSKPYFDKKTTWDFKPFNRHLFVGENVATAWFDELLDTQMGVCRGSGVLQKVNSRWKIAQYVLSATIPNDIIKNVTLMKSGSDSVLLLKSVFDRYNMSGTTIISQKDDDRCFGYNAALWDSGYLPASTFKIANMLIGLETGVIDTGYIFRWNGEKRRLPQWEQDLSLRKAFQVSCVPCFQELARKIGSDRMISYLGKIGYPGMDVHTDNIDLFWLEGGSRITPRQQMQFIRNLYEGRLRLKPSVIQAVKEIMINEVKDNYTLSGKTGWAIRNGLNYGWFVGYVETKGRVYYITTLVEPNDQEKVEDFTVARKLVTLGVLRCLKLIPAE